MLQDDMSMPCRIRPGIYVISDPVTQQVVGYMFIFPNCSIEIYPATGG